MAAATNKLVEPSSAFSTPVNVPSKRQHGQSNPPSATKSPLAVPSSSRAADLRNRLEKVEAELTELLISFANPPLSTPLFAHSGRSLQKLVTSYDAASWIRIFSGIHKNMCSILAKQEQYLTALEKLLVDACIPEENGGMDEDRLLMIYDRILVTLELVSETQMRVEMAKFMEDTFSAKSSAALEVQGAVLLREIPAVRGDMADLLKRKSEEMRKNVTRVGAPRRQKCRALLAKRGIAIVNEAAEQSELDLEEEQMQLADTGEYHINDAEQMDPSADESLNSDGVPKKAGTVKL